jgi:Uncharacterized Fe-S protein
MVVGRVESIWRYPVKSMRGEKLSAAFAGFSGIYGDRVYAFKSSAAPKGFPYLTGREQGLMLQCRAAFRHKERLETPPNLADAEKLGPGVTPLYADPGDLMVDVATPDGEVLPIDDPRLIEKLGDGQRTGLELTLLRSERALTDCRPMSLFSTATVAQLGDEVGTPLDKRRFRANIYVDLASGTGFGENAWVGKRLRLGPKAELVVLERDPRCKMITLDPETAEPNPEVMRRLAKDHDGTAGVYAAVLVEGVVRSGDEIVVIDSNQTRLRDFATRYTAAWCSQDPESVASFFAANGSLKVNDGPPAVGRPAITEVARGFMSAFPDMRVLMDEVSGDERTAIYRWTLVGTNTGPGGKGHAVRISGSEEWQFDPDGLVAESLGHFDAADYQRQIEGR